MVKKINKSLRILSTTKRSKERNKFLKSNQIFKEIWRKKKGKKIKENGQQQQQQQKISRKIIFECS